MEEQKKPFRASLIRGIAMVKAIQAAETREEAHEEIVGATHELTNADAVLLIAPGPSGSLEVLRHAGDAAPEKTFVELALADARAALARHEGRKLEAAQAGHEIRNVGTDDSGPVPSMAKVLWSEDRVFGVLAI